MMKGMEEALPREIPKPWGSELWFAHTDRYAGKILRGRASQRRHGIATALRRRLPSETHLRDLAK